MQNNFKLSSLMLVMAVGLTSGAYGANRPAQQAQAVLAAAPGNIPAGHRPINPFPFPGNVPMGAAFNMMKQARLHITRCDTTYEIDPPMPGMFVNRRQNINISWVAGAPAGAPGAYNVALRSGDVASYNLVPIGTAVAALVGILYVCRNRIRPYLQQAQNRLTNLFKKNPKKAEGSTPLKA